MSKDSLDIRKAFSIAAIIICVFILPIFIGTGNGFGVTTIVFSLIVAGAIIFWYSSINIPEPPKRKAKYKQYDENRYADYFMEQIKKAGIKVNPENPVAINENEDDENNLNEVEENDTLYKELEYTISDSQYPTSPTFSYEAEDNELRQRAFNHFSTLTAIIAILWLAATTYLPPEIEELKLFLESGNFLSLLIKIIPGFIFIISSIVSILANRLDENKGFILIYIRPIFFILICIGCIYNEILIFTAN